MNSRSIQIAFNSNGDNNPNKRIQFLKIDYDKAKVLEQKIEILKADQKRVQTELENKYAYFIICETPKFKTLLSVFNFLWQNSWVK